MGVERQLSGEKPKFGIKTNLEDIPTVVNKYGTSVVPAEEFPYVRPTTVSPKDQVFDESKHLDLETLPFVYLGNDAQDVNRSESSGPLAFAGPFKLLSSEGIEAVANELNLFKDGVCLKTKSNIGDGNRHAYCLRGLSYHSNFFHDFARSPAITDLVSKYAGERVVPMTIQSNLMHTNYGWTKSGKIDQWHCDSVPYVLVCIASDLGPDSEGGNLECILATKEDAGELIMKHKGNIPQEHKFTLKNSEVGKGVLLQGSEVVHHVSQLTKGNDPRITLIFAFQPADPFAMVQSRMKFGRDFDGESIAIQEFGKTASYRVAQQLMSFAKGDIKFDDAESMAKFLDEAKAELAYSSAVLRDEVVDSPWISPEFTPQTSANNSDTSLTGKH